MGKGLSFKDLLNIILRGKYFIGTLCIIFVAISFFGARSYKNSTAKFTAIVSMQWENIENGKYPDGTKFLYNDIKQPEIIANALRDIGLSSLTTDEIRHAFTVTPLLSASAQAAIEKAISEGETYSYYPTSFKLSLDIGSLQLDNEISRDLLSSIIEEYKMDFEEKFVKRNLVAKVIDDDLTTYDYIDIISIFENQIQLIDSAVSIQTDSDKNNISADFTIRFNDITIRTNLIKQVKLQQISSRVNTYLLTKDKNYMLLRFTTDLNKLKLDLAKQQQKETMLQNLIANYDGSTETIIIPGMDPSQTLEIDTYYDTLISELFSAENSQINIQSDISNLQSQIDRLQGNAVGETDLTAEDEQTEIEKVENTIRDIKDSMNGIITDTNELLTEHYQTLSNGIIEPLMVPDYESDVNILLYCLAGFILALLLGSMLVLIHYYLNHKKEIVTKKI